MKLGRLNEVDVRELWKHEQYDFSNWLALEENIALLNDTLGLSLIDVDKEVYVGAYRCDLVARDEITGVKVIIENQLEASNHDHLGKIITYASGLDASVVVWVVTRAREEHRSAIEWLNNNTGSNLNFFLLEIHAYRIGDSLAAPKFEVIEKPNDFIKYAKGIKTTNEITKTQAECLAFWMMFNDVLDAQNNPINPTKATIDHWRNVAIGSSEACVSINLVNKDNCVVVDVYIFDNKDLFDGLYSQREEIEHALGYSLDWQRIDDKKASRIKYTIFGLNFNDHSNYRALMDEIINRATQMREVFSMRVKGLL